uniref:Uncharacterized protein n=1 Tax=Ditylenchus dipsaci TaxID=166011 RepID=A0A915D184_9BILA
MGNENSSSTAVYSGRIAPFGQEHGLAGLNAVAKRTGKKAPVGPKRNAKQAGRSRSTSNLKSAAEADSTGSANSNSSDLASSSLETGNTPRKGSGSGLVGQFIKNHHHQHLVQGSNFRKHSCSHLQQQSVQSSQSVDMMGNENSSSTAVYSGRIAPFGQEHGLAGLNAVAKRTGKKAPVGPKRNAKQAGRSRSTSNLKSAAEADSTGSANSNSSDLASSSLETGNTPRKGSGSGLVGQFIKNHHHQHLVQGSNFRKHSCSHLQQQSVQSSQSVDSGCSSSSTSVQLEVGLLSPDSTTMLLNTNHSYLKPLQGNGPPQRKHSFSEAKELSINNSRLGAPAANHTLVAGKGADRRRSRSLCAQQLKADCQ